MTGVFDNSGKQLVIQPMEIHRDVMNETVYNFKGRLVGFGIYVEVDPRIMNIYNWCLDEAKGRYHWYSGKQHTFSFAVDFYDRDDAMRFKLTWV